MKPDLNKNPHAQALGALGGLRATPAQKVAGVASEIQGHGKWRANNPLTFAPSRSQPGQCGGEPRKEMKMNTGKFKIQQLSNEGLGWVDIANGFETWVEAEKDMEENKNEYSCHGLHELRIVPTAE